MRLTWIKMREGARGVAVAPAALSRGLRQGPAIAAEITHLWRSTHRVMRFGIHRAAPDALLLCHWWWGNAREMWGFVGESHWFGALASHPLR